MGFEKFGLVSSTAESRVAKFVDCLEQGKIMATRCLKCDAKFFPPQAECSKCLSAQVEWFEIDRNGKLITYTLVRYGPAGFEKATPYTLAIGEFGDGLKILGHLSRNIPAGDIKIGMKIIAAPVKLDGNKIGYEFQKG